MKYESVNQPILKPRLYAQRVFWNLLIAMGVIGGALAIGMVGYHELAGLPWVDSLLNASMILGGMGPVDPLHTDASKIFASFYALFSGIIFLSAVALIFAPILHRFLHRLHLDEESE